MNSQVSLNLGILASSSHRVLGPTNTQLQANRPKAADRTSLRQGKWFQIKRWCTYLLLIAALCFPAAMSGSGGSSPSILTSPAPGSTLTGSNATFTWLPTAGVSAYQLQVGTTGVGSSNIYNGQYTTAISAFVSGIPTGGGMLYVRVRAYLSNTWQYSDSVLIEAGTSAPAVLTAPRLGDRLAGTSATFVWTAGSGVNLYQLQAGTAAAGSNNIYIGQYTTATSATVSGIPAAGGTLYVRLRSYINGVWQYADYTFIEPGNAAPAVLSSPGPGATLAGTSAVFSWTAGSGVSSYQLILGTTGAGSGNIYTGPYTSATSMNIAGIPAAGGTLYARLRSYINGSWRAVDSTLTEAPALPVLNSVSCANLSMTGAGTIQCTVALSGAAPAGGVSLSLVSNNTAVQLPAAIAVPAGALGAGFSAAISSVGTAQLATITASTGGIAKSFALQLNAAIPALNLSAASISFGDQVVNTSATQLVTLTSTGNVPVTVNSATLTGAGFTVSGANFPVTLNPGQATSLILQFVPTATGTVAGQLTILSNSTSNGKAVVNLSGNGTPAPGTLSAISCTNASLSGAGSDACTVTLNAPAASGGLLVSLVSNNPNLQLPANVTVPGYATSAAFSAIASTVSTAQTVTLTATAGGISQSFTIQLNAAVPILTADAGSITFGDLVVNSASTQSVTLTSSGTAPVTINSASLTGTGFSLSAPTLPITLNPGQAVTLNVQFAPVATGAASGNLTISSNSTANSTLVIGMSGTGDPHQVELTWSAPSSSVDPVVGYGVYRATGAASSYQRLNASVETQTAFLDTDVQSGLTYRYVVTSVDASGVESAPSNSFSATIP